MSAHVCVELREGNGYLGTGVTDGYEPSGMLEIEPGPWEEHQMLLATTELISANTKTFQLGILTLQSRYCLLQLKKTKQKPNQTPKQT